MILKALYDYYHRSKELARPGMEYKEIAFLIVIDEQGNFLRLEDCRIDNKRCKSFLVPKSVSRSSNPVANICWDNCSYVLNYSEANLPLKNPPADIQKLAVPDFITFFNFSYKPALQVSVAAFFSLIWVTHGNFVSSCYVCA